MSRKEGESDQELLLRQTADKGMRAITWGIVVSAILGTVKLVSGIVGHSYALIADGIESMLDIVSSMVVWGGLRIASQPATDDHPYGFGKAEPLAALAVAVALLGAAIGISIQSIHEIMNPHLAPAPFTLIILVFVIVAKEIMFQVFNRIGKRIGSKALETDAWHHRSDSLTSIAAMIGISIALFAGEGYESADDWAALFAAGVIAFNGVRLFRGALREILDVSPPQEVVDKIMKTAKSVSEVADLDKCRVRRSGLVLFVDIHVIVDGERTVRDGHRISHEVKDALMEGGFGIQDVTVHIEPTALEEK